MTASPPGADTGPAVRLRDVRKSYAAGGGRRAVVLGGVSLSIDHGELVGIVGPSGCGKTTLLNLIGGLDRPDAGDVSVCGLDLMDAGRAELTAFRAHSIGLVFQFYNLLPTLTALENVVAGTTIAGVDRGEAEQRGRRLLTRVGVGELANRFPGQLSGGEQQRVALVRALAKQPALVLADEPTGNLDEDSSDRVLELIGELNEETGVTFIIVSHNPAIAAVVERTVQLARGRVIHEPPGPAEAAPP